MKRLKSRIFGSLLILLVTMIYCLAAAPRNEPIREVNSGLPANEMAWNQLTGNTEEEHIFMIGFFEGGIHTFTTFFTFKYGPFQRWGFYTLLQEDGVEDIVFVKAECPEKRTKISYTSYDFSCGETTYSGKWPDYILKIRDPELTADIKFHALVPPFTPGKFLYTPDGSVFSKCIVHVPRAKTEATLTYRGKTIKVGGEGYADHTHQNIPFTRIGPAYYAVRAFPDFNAPPKNQFYLNFSLQGIHQAYGGGYDAFAHVVQDKKIVGVTRNLTIEPLNEVTDADTGYKYVTRVAIKVNDPEISFRGTFSVTKTIEIMDIFKWIPPYVRKIAVKFFKRPVYFRFIGILEGQLKTKEGTFPIRQRATSEMNFTQ